VNRREVFECDGWVCVLEVVDNPSRFRLIRKDVAFPMGLPTFTLNCEENATRQKWKSPLEYFSNWTSEDAQKWSVSRWPCKIRIKSVSPLGKNVHAQTKHGGIWNNTPITIHKHAPSRSRTDCTPGEGNSVPPHYSTLRDWVWIESSCSTSSIIAVHVLVTIFYTKASVPTLMHPIPTNTNRCDTPIPTKSSGLGGLLW
jgi:hypothetical protein